MFAEAERALEHALVRRVREEFDGNMDGIFSAGLPQYGLRKVMHYVAIVARAQALGIDPDVLRMTEAEGREADRRLVRAVAESGIPTVVLSEGGQQE